MRTNVTFRHFNANDDLQNAALSQATGFTKYLDGITSTDVIFHKDQERTVEFTVKAKGNTFVASDSSESFHRSLNEASDKIVRQLKKWKTKKEK